MRRLAIPLILFTAAPAQAQSPTALMKCVAIARDADRLACFDAALANASPQARAASEQRAAETARIAAADAVAAAEIARQKAEAEVAAQRSSFGAETLANRKDRPGPAPGDVTEVPTTIVEILTNLSGLGVFLLENGQLWKQVDTARLPRARPGDAVTLTRAELGGYHLNFVRQKNWVLVKRVK